VEKAESPEGHFHEDDAAILIRDILDAIRYMHDEKHVVHRDLKVRLGMKLFPMTNFEHHSTLTICFFLFFFSPTARYENGPI
jgi:serine/threonine protein kinase